MTDQSSVCIIHLYQCSPNYADLGFVLKCGRFAQAGHFEKDHSSSYRKESAGNGNFTDHYPDVSGKKKKQA